MAPHLRQLADSSVEAFFQQRDPGNLRSLRQAQSLYSQVLDHDRKAGSLQELVDTLGAAAEVSLLLGATEVAERLFAELLGLDACAHERRLKSQASCAAFAGSKLAILRRTAGDASGAASAFASATARGASWTTPWQLPPEHYKGLVARAVWPAQEVPLAVRLADNFESIVKDFEQLAAEADRKKGAVRWEPTQDFFLLEAGAWREIPLKAASWNAAACKLAPNVCSLLRGQPEVDGKVERDGQDLLVPGRVGFLRMGPGSKLRPHTANWNGRLNVHMPVRVPTRCGASGCGALRVADEPPVEWRLGEPIVFDDSFVHSVTLPADAEGERVVLHVSIWHPDLVIEGRPKSEL